MWGMRWASFGAVRINNTQPQCSLKRTTQSLFTVPTVKTPVQSSSPPSNAVQQCAQRISPLNSQPHLCTPATGSYYIDLTPTIRKAGTADSRKHRRLLSTLAVTGKGWLHVYQWPVR